MVIYTWWFVCKQTDTQLFLKKTLNLAENVFLRRWAGPIQFELQTSKIGEQSETFSVIFKHYA